MLRQALRNRGGAFSLSDLLVDRRLDQPNGPARQNVQTRRLSIIFFTSGIRFAAFAMATATNNPGAQRREKEPTRFLQRATWNWLP